MIIPEFADPQSWWCSLCITQMHTVKRAASAAYRNAGKLRVRRWTVSSRCFKWERLTVWNVSVHQHHTCIQNFHNFNSEAGPMYFKVMSLYCASTQSWKLEGPVPVILFLIPGSVTPNFWFWRIAVTYTEFFLSFPPLYLCIPCCYLLLWGIEHLSYVSAKQCSRANI